MTYDPGKLPFDTTLARQITKQHLDNFNDVWWVGERSFRHLRRSYNAVAMPTPGPGVHGYFRDAAQWAAGVDRFRIWHRQHILISAASLLEVYVQSASVAALTASPELVDRSLKGLGGAVFVKHPDRMPGYLKELVKTRSDSFTHGRWADRLQRIRLVFGDLPTGLASLTANLQSVQDKRNRIAHSYGMGGELRRTPWEPIQAILVTPKQIEDAIKDVSAAIRYLDSDVFGPVIGGFELLHEYHVWCKAHHEDLSRMRVAGTLAADFKSHIAESFGASPSVAYVKEAIAYYDALA